MSYVVVNLSLFVVICTARKGFLFCNKVIIIYWSRSRHRNEIINYLEIFVDTSNENAITRLQELLNVEVVMAAIH